MAGPLDDLLVLDLTRALAGPIAGRLLSDLGAEVVKVEQIIERSSHARTLVAGLAAAPVRFGGPVGAPQFSWGG